jgi:hypothetical protein
LITGYIFFYFSELVFWARPRPEDNLLNWLETWLAYSLMAFLFLVVVTKFNVNSIPALFLVGAFFGWIGEGIIVQTTYENLPLSISFTGLSWHALITVLLGWYGLQIALGKNTKQSLIHAFFLGFFFWLWGISWIYEEPGTAVNPGIFTFYVFITTLLLGFCLFVSSQLFKKPFSLSPWAIRIVAGIFLALYLLVIITGQVKALILIPLMAIIYLSLRQNRNHHTGENVLETLATFVPIRRYLVLILIPATSSVLYYIYFHSGLKFPTNWLIYIITTPAGFLLFGWSIWMIWRKNLNSNRSI